jgi:hypothetical protein
MTEERSEEEMENLVNEFNALPMPEAGMLADGIRIGHSHGVTHGGKAQRAIVFYFVGDVHVIGAESDSPIAKRVQHVVAVPTEAVPEIIADLAGEMLLSYECDGED